MPAQSAFKAALQRRQYANRPSLVPLLQLTDRFNGSITAALNVLLSTDLATFLIGLSGLESPLLSLLQQYILAPPGTRGTTDELCALMASSSPSSSPSPPPSSPKKSKFFFSQEMKSTCRDQARKSKNFFLMMVMMASSSPSSSPSPPPSSPKKNPKFFFFKK